MKALVTGATGFIGSKLCRFLLDKGYSVRAFHRPSSPLRALENLDLEHAVGDLSQPETLVSAMRDINIVFHAAALTNGRAKPSRIYDTIVDGTSHMIKAAMESKIERLIFTSSVASLGIPERNPSGRSIPALLNENHTWNDQPERWYYGYAKYLAEIEIQKAVSKGFDAVIVNPALVLGAGDIYRQSDSIVVQETRKKIPALVEGGLNVVHIDDVTAGHLAALERGKRGERYILSGENLSFEELFQQIGEITHIPPPSVVLSTRLVKSISNPLRLAQSFIALPVSAELLGLAGNYFFYDNRKAQIDLGLSPSHSAREAITDTYNWFKNMGAIS
jgi:dihydroflavonol-4-reductase